jgi:hypothetical protein
MSLQPMIKPILDFTVQSVDVPQETTHGSRVFVALVHYAYDGTTFDAHIHFDWQEGELQVATQGQRMGVPMQQILGSLLAKINGGAHVPQTH